jgi:lysophospholipase L1-like esterase
MQNGELEGLSPKVVVLQCGTNNLPWRGAARDEKVDEAVTGTHAIVEEFQKRTPKATIILTAMFPRDQNPALKPAISKINERIRELADGKRVRFLNINKQLMTSNGRLRPDVSKDGLHLAQPGYEVWASDLKPILTELLGPPKKTDNAPPPTGNPAANK